MGATTSVAGTGASEFQPEEAAGGKRKHGGGSNSLPRYTRRLSDKILIAFHHACDQQDLEVAEQLLQVVQMMLTRRGVPQDATKRHDMESLVAAHERLWHLRFRPADQS